MTQPGSHQLRELERNVPNSSFALTKFEIKPYRVRSNLNAAAQHRSANIAIEWVEIVGLSIVCRSENYKPGQMARKET